VFVSLSVCVLACCACVSTYSAGGFGEGGQGGRQAVEVQGLHDGHDVAFEPILARELERSPTNPTAYDAYVDKGAHSVSALTPRTYEEEDKCIHAGAYSVSALTPRLRSLLCNSMLLPQVSAPHMTSMYPSPHISCLSARAKVLLTLL
jgi:hypothetical protein